MEKLEWIWQYGRVSKGCACFTEIVWRAESKVWTGNFNVKARKLFSALSKKPDAPHNFAKFQQNKHTSGLPSFCNYRMNLTVRKSFKEKFSRIKWQIDFSENPKMIGGLLTGIFNIPKLSKILADCKLPQFLRLALSATNS